MSAKLWIGTALTPYRNECGLVAVVAETHEEAMAKAGAKLARGDPVITSRASGTRRTC
ncbi:MAG TPA: hypothetical protein VN255_00565 [Mycobacterium sp.]|nr:hypothetical protein [Mycobacterium sp.]